MLDLQSLLNPNVLFENTVIFLLLTLFISFYGNQLAPKLPSSLKKLLDNYVFKAIIIFLILYSNTFNLSMSITILVVFLYLTSLYQTEEAFTQCVNHNRKD